MDHAPGPIIAGVPPRVANKIGAQGSPIWVITTHSSKMATSAPTTGVQRPTRRSIAALAPMSQGIVDAEKEPLESWMIPNRTSTMAVATL